MKGFSHRWALVVGCLVLAGGLVAGACGKPSSAATPFPSNPRPTPGLSPTGGTSTPNPTSVLFPAATPTRGAAPTSITGASPAPASTPPGTNTSPPAIFSAEPTPVPLFIDVSEPEDGDVLDVDSVTIRGTTAPMAMLTIGGGAVDVNPDGSFEAVLILDEGPNLVELAAQTEDGQEASADLILSYLP